jgi:predicted nucleic acid-binding protein
MVLIDTSAWIHALRPDGDVKIREKVRHHLAEGIAATTEIVVLELLKGTSSDKDYSELKESLDALIQLETTKEVWEKAFRISLDLRRKGVSIPATDLLISAIAVHYDCYLHHNDKHFTLAAAKIGLKAI